jgi:hypothetical protein
MTEHRVLTNGKQRRRLVPEWDRRKVGDDVDAVMHPDQMPAFQPRSDHVVRHPDNVQLPARDPATLLGRDRADPAVWRAANPKRSLSPSTLTSRASEPGISPG